MVTAAPKTPTPETAAPEAAEAPIEAEMPSLTRSGKSQAAFRTISEVADELDVAQHVLRFWESKFPQVRPLKRGGGRRYYRPEDIELLRDIRALLYDEGYTIKGAQKLLRMRRAKPAPSAASATTVRPPAPPPAQPAQGQLAGTLAPQPAKTAPASSPSATDEPATAGPAAVGETAPEPATPRERLAAVRHQLLELRHDLEKALAEADH